MKKRKKRRRRFKRKRSAANRTGTSRGSGRRRQSRLTRLEQADANDIDDGEMHSDDGDFNIHEELLLQDEEVEAESEVASSTQLSMSVLEESHIRIRPRRKRPVRV